MSIAAPLAIATGLAGAGISAFGTYEGGQAQARAANYAAQVARNNSQIAEQNAQYAIAAGQRQASDTSLREAQRFGSIKARQGAGGVDVNTGSNAAVQASQRKMGALDIATVLNNSELAAYGYRSQAANFQAQAGLETNEAQQAPIGADLAAAGGFLGSASGTAFKFSQLGPPVGQNQDQTTGGP